MKYLALIFISILLASCSGAEEAETTENIGETDDFNQDVFGVIASFDTTQSDNAEIISIPIYSTDKSKKAIDSLYYLKHMGRYHAFYINSELEKNQELGEDGSPISKVKSYKNEGMVMPNHGEYFNYYVGDWMHQGLTFIGQQEDRYRVLNKSLGESAWIDINDFPAHFEPYLWNDFFNELDYSNVKIVPTGKELEMFNDTTFEFRSGIIRSEYESYYEVVSSDSIYFQVARFKVDNWQFSEDFENVYWPWYVPKDTIYGDTGWIKMVDNGIPMGKFDMDPVNNRNSRFGIGLLKGEATYWSRNKLGDAEMVQDKIKMIDPKQNKEVGHVPIIDDKLNIFNISINDTTYEIPWGFDQDRSQGLSSWEFLQVYEEEKGLIRLFKGKFKEDFETWVRKDALKDYYEFYYWDQYFLHFLDGNDGWNSGYTWVGGYDYIYSEPSTKSDRLIELPAQGSIFLTGKTEGAWAEVKFKELEHIFGEIYYTGSDKRFHTWKGWIRMTDIHGHANLEEIILGC